MYEYNKYHYLVAKYFHSLIPWQTKEIKKKTAMAKLLNVNPNLSYTTKYNYILKSIKILKRYGLEENNNKISIPKLSNFYRKSSNVSDEEFLFKLLKEVHQKGGIGINQGDVLNKFYITKLLLLDKKETTILLHNLMVKNYITFGHLTGGTINFVKEKINRNIKKNKYKKIYEDYNINKF